MDPPLFWRCIAILEPPPRPLFPITLPLPTDDTEPRRAMRFVMRLATGSGEVAFDRSAAPAAAAERFTCEALRAAIIAALETLGFLSGVCPKSVPEIVSRVPPGQHTGSRRRENMPGILTTVEC